MIDQTAQRRETKMTDQTETNNETHTKEPQKLLRLNEAGIPTRILSLASAFPYVKSAHTFIIPLPVK